MPATPETSFILNGSGHGSAAHILLNNDMSPGALRPIHIGRNRSRICYTNNRGKKVSYVQNAPATLTKDAWQQLDRAILKVALPRLQFWTALRNAASVTLPNGMGTTVFQYQTQSDISDAEIAMDGIKRSPRDRPLYDIVNLPMPVIFKDYGFTAREIATSQNSGAPLDTTMAELAARQVAEKIERLSLGIDSSFTYGGGTLYGAMNFPDRLTKTLTLPTATAWTPATLVQEVLQMKTQSQDANYRGPWMLFFSTPWDEYLDDDYSAAKGDNTLRERLRKIQGIQDVVTLDHLDSNQGYVVLMIQMTSDVVRAVIGMEMTTVQWPIDGGMGFEYKVLAIYAPQFRSDYNSQTGIVHGTAA